MFADDRSIDNLQQLFIEFKKYLNLQKEYTTIGGYHSWHGGTVLFVVCAGLYFRSARRRTHGKLQHYRLFPPSAGSISNYFPQKTHRQPDGEFYCRIVF